VDAGPLNEVAHRARHPSYGPRRTAEEVRKDLAAAAQKLSAGYRQGATSHGIATPLDAKAYAVARMPATYAACAAAFARLTEVMPDFAPASLLDVGAGTGAASWAAITAWPGIGAVVMLDRNPALRDLARKLADAGPMPDLEILSGDVTAGKPKADLVVASYVLAEFAQERAAAVAVDLWGSAGAALVLVEPGTPIPENICGAARRPTHPTAR